MKRIAGRDAHAFRFGLTVVHVPAVLALAGTATHEENKEYRERCFHIFLRSVQ